MAGILGPRERTLLVLYRVSHFCAALSSLASSFQALWGHSGRIRRSRLTYPVSVSVFADRSSGAVADQRQ